MLTEFLLHKLAYPSNQTDEARLNDLTRLRKLIMELKAQANKIIPDPAEVAQEKQNATRVDTFLKELRETDPEEFEKVRRLPYPAILQRSIPRVEINGGGLG